LLFIVGCAGLGAMLVCISVQIDRCRLEILRALDDIRGRELPYGYSAVEYHPDGKIKATGK
jgi:hypothetical protein